MAKAQRNTLRVTEPQVMKTQDGEGVFIALPNPNGGDRSAICLGATKVQAVLNHITECEVFLAEHPAQGRAKAKAEPKAAALTPEEALKVLASDMGVPPAQLEALLSAAQ